MHAHSWRFFGLSMAAVAIALTVAPPASAGQAEFLHAVQYKYAFLTPQQLITAGNEVCAFTSRGGLAADAVTMVRNDLGISVSAAADIVSAAIVELC
jgi:hypothetical protein